ncbi:MAG: asparagine synthase-related protein [Actinomycetota bacterium]
MAGIAGAWSMRGRPAEPEVLAAMGARIEHRAPDGIHLWAEGSIGLISALSRITPESRSETQPTEHPSGVVIVFDGRLDDRDRLIAALGPVDPAMPDARLVLEAYLKFGDRFPERLEGDFALAIFDPARQELFLCRDSMGMRPLFVYRSSELVVFGSEIKAILAHPDVPAAPDEEELAVYVLSGAAQGSGIRTFFAGIERVLPSHVMRFTPRGAAKRMYWDFDPWRQVRRSSFEEYAEGFRHYFEQSVRRRLRSALPVAVSVSGGLDSSSIYCLAETLRRSAPGEIPEIVPITFSPSDGTVADEWPYIVDIEERYGITMIDVPPKAVRPTTVAREVVWRAEIPGTETFWDCMRSVHQRVRQEGARVLISGHLGDQYLFDRAYLVDLFDRLRWFRIISDTREWPRWNLEGDTSPLQREFFRRVVRDHLPLSLLPAARWSRAKVERPLWDRPWFTERFRQLGSQAVTTRPLVRWQFASAHAYSIYCQARGPASMLALEACDRAWAAYGLECVFPYADRDLVAYLMAMPGDMVTFGGVPRAILRESVRDVLPESIRLRRWKGSFGHMIDDAVLADRDGLVEAASRFSASVDMGYVDGRELRRAVATLREGPVDEMALAGLNNTLALDAWCSTFFPQGRGSD